MNQLYISLITLFLFSGCTLKGNYSSVYDREEIKISLKNDVVYVCGGKYSKKFHSYSSCRGLNNCKSKVS
ncbi:hypothetical protein HNQ88_002253 [Aureibacter tunicatorum]|uniref:Uncharacterized protein n=1 Tax=Aureibacter tunicatorum TaxID=866807 RepID=A0AAE4BRZ4_9BACT|nr:hypothetical protein [Aureibacter tunicatorum]BDD04859.1 hypothetical protein AUTU_23420 [Aureibacter tunicatorum]